MTLTPGMTLLPPAELTPWAENPRTITTERLDALKRALAASPGQLRYRPVVALVDGRIVAGNMRHRAAVELLESDDELGAAFREEYPQGAIPVGVVDLDEREAIEWALRDNNEFGRWDDDLLRDTLVRLQAIGGDVDLTGFPTGDVRKILSRVAGEDEPWTSPKPRGRPRSKRGKVYEVGPHRIMVGDSTNADDVATLMRGERADLLVTSPPYNVDVPYGDHEDQSEWTKYVAFLRALLAVWAPVVGEGRAVAWNVGANPQTRPYWHAVLLEEAGLEFVRELVWKKVGVASPMWHNTLADPVARRFTPNFQHELVYVFAKGPLALGAPLDVVDALATNDVFELHQAQATVDVSAGPSRTGARSAGNMTRRAYKLHPAPFPVRLPQMLATHLTGPGELVVDPFVGSGSTMIAAERLGRRCYGMDVDPVYVDEARDRLARTIEQAAA